MRVVELSEVELGLKFTKIWPVGNLPADFPTVVVTPTPQNGADSWSAFAADSMVKRGFKQLVSQGSAKENEVLVSCTYAVRPWITRKLERTETVAGIFKLRDGGKVHEIYFCYDP